MNQCQLVKNSAMKINGANNRKKGSFGNESYGKRRRSCHFPSPVFILLHSK